jgi:hypothetical protein
MIHVKQYRPAFFEGFTDQEANVRTPEELLALEWVSNFMRGSAEKFYRFSISHPYTEYPTYHNLMAEYDEGRRWLVVANLSGDPEEDFFKYFPTWHPRN